jgi:hypothetical protein
LPKDASPTANRPLAYHFCNAPPDITGMRSCFILRRKPKQLYNKEGITEAIQTSLHSFGSPEKPPTCKVKVSFGAVVYF